MASIIASVNGSLRGDGLNENWFVYEVKTHQVVEAMDGGVDIRNLEAWKKAVEMRSGSFPKGVKYFFLNKLFGMRPSEIAKMEGVGSSGVRAVIARVADRLSAGEMDLWEVTPQVAAEAKARLQLQKEKRRQK